MRAPLSWLRDWVALPAETTAEDLAAPLTSLGLTVERIETISAGWTGPVVVGRVLECTREPQKNGKTISWCLVDVGEHNNPATAELPAHRGIVCGAPNVAAGQLVVVALPGSMLPGDFAIAARKTYGHVSDGMICAVDELGIGTDHEGILVLPPSIDGRELVPGEDATPLLITPDQVLDIDVTPDLSYCLSIRGLARELALATGSAFTDPAASSVPASTQVGHPVQLDDPSCPLFVALTLESIDATLPTPSVIARRLELAGMRSISLPVDVTNYVMLETGQPLHAYDADKLSGAIVVRRAQSGETVTTLDDQQRQLDVDDLVITDDSGVIGIAGVMGGASTEVSASTTRIVLEAAHFDAASISRSMRRHKLPSEASKRFERGVDPAATHAAAQRAAALLIEHGGARLSGELTVAGAVPASRSQTMSTELPAQILGLEVAPDRVVEILESVGVVVHGEGGQLTLTPPSWRTDLADRYDYVEEVARKIGLENIPSVVPQAPVGRGLTRAQRLRRAVNAQLAAQGFVEALTLPFVNDRDLDLLELPADDDRRRVVRLANPLADTQPYLRTSLLPGLFAAVLRNSSRGLDDVALHEAGAVFLATDQATAAPMPAVTQRPSADELNQLGAALAEQPRLLAAVACGAWRRPGWKGAGELVDWTTAVAAADAAAEAVGLRLDRRPAQMAPWHPGRCAALMVGEQVLGHAGELHPRVCESFGLPARTAAMELDLDALFSVAPLTGELAALSSRPVAKEDVALVVDASVSHDQVRDALIEGGGELLESVTLFDVYTGQQIGEGKKSLAFALRLRASDRTLKDAEVAAVRQAAVAVASDRCGAVLRD